MISFVSSTGLCHRSRKTDSRRETVLFVMTDSMVKSLDHTELCQKVMCDLSHHVPRTEVAEFDNR